MKKWKLTVFCVWILACLMMNYFGIHLGTLLGSIFWFDSFGTVICAYVAGPICGALVGMTTNLIFYVQTGDPWIYCAISAMIGLFAGIAFRRQQKSTLFNILTIGGMLALLVVIMAVPMNYIFNDGSTGNRWGDAVIGFMRGLNLPPVICLAIGQLYVELLDKVVIMLLLFIVIRLINLSRFRDYLFARDSEAGEAAKKAIRTAAFLLAAGLALSGIPANGAAAEEDAGDTDGNAASAGINFNDYVQTVYSSQNGLPCGEANDIVQTTDGILWIGTYAGLYRYNGREFRWMDYESVRNVNVLYVDEEGRLWIGTNDNGLSIVINEHVVNVIDQSGGLPSNSVRAIVRSSDGYYYIGTTGSMQVLSLNYGLKQLNTLAEIHYANNISADDDGHVAVITSDGKLYLLAEGQILSSRQVVDSDTVFKSCQFDRNGHLLAATTGREIHEFDISDGWFREIGRIQTGSLESIKDMERLSTGELLITADNGVGIIETDGSFELINTNHFNNSIDKMLIDYQGNMWFTSSRLGLLRMAPSDFRDVYSTVGMDSRVVNTIVRWKGAYYIGTDKGLDIVDETCNHQVESELTERLKGCRIRCMTVDRNNHLWICTYNKGLIEVEPQFEIQHVYNSAADAGFGSRARVVTQLSDGTILAGGDTGLTFIRDTEIIKNLKLSMILTITEMDDGTILAGTDGDGIAVIRNGEVESTLTRADGLSSEVILRTVKDSKTGGVFVVTSNGLCYMSPDGKIRTLNNFPYFNNYDIWIKGTDSLFVMSSAGIYVVDRSELLSGKNDMAYELLNTRRGLNSSLTANSWTYYNEETGELFLACDTGVFVINTARYSAGTRSYRMSVPSVRVDGKSKRLDRGTDLVLGQGTNKIELYPEVVNYSIQDPYIGYMLEGFDPDWTIVQQNALNTITYTNLPSGNYTFRLAVFDNNQENILAERTYTITKSQEIYQSRGFIVYLLVVPMLTVAWVTGLFVKRRNEKTERELAEANRQIEMGKQTVAAIANAVDAKDERTGGHSNRVSIYSGQIARICGFTEEQCRQIEWAARLHDIGKIAIPDNILNKDSRLTDEEYAKMKSHTLEGAKILKDFTLLDHVTEGAEFHHERPDGRGYPKGLKGEEIPLFARIIGVADAFDAMTATRVYRKQMDMDYVLGELEKGRGTQFFPEYVDALLKLIRSKEIDVNALYNIQEEAGTTAEKQRTEEKQADQSQKKEG